MKSEIICIVYDSVAEYPKLMKLKSCGCVVLFWGEEIGVVIHEDYCPRDKRYYRKGDFYDRWDMSYLEQFDGIVKLQN